MNRRWFGRVRLGCFAFGLAASLSGCSKESIVVELGPGESVATMAASGDALAIGIAQREAYDPSKGVGALEARAAVALVREGAPIVRTPIERGYLRGIASTASGFVVLRVLVPGGTEPTAAHVFRVDLSGNVTPLAPLTMDPIGLWVGENGAVFVYSAKVVVRWTEATGGWSPVRLDPAVVAGPIRKMVGLRGGQVAVTNDREIIGLAHLEAPPKFVRDLNAYPYPLKLYADGERWWLVVPAQDSQKVIQVTPDGDVREIATMRVVNVHELLFSGDKVIVVCGREGGNVHKSSFYLLERTGAAPMSGPYRLPDDTTATAVWGRLIASGGPMRRVSRASIP